MDIDSAIGWLIAVIGTVVLAAGAVLLFAPGTANGLPINLIVADAAALGALALGGWVVRERYGSSVSLTAVPDIEFNLATPSPGNNTDQIVYRMTHLQEGAIEYREQIQEKVAEVAIGVITQVQDCSRAAAIEQLESGEWTDDTLAASFFSNQVTRPSPSITTQLKRRFRSDETDYERQLRATVNAIEEYASAIDVDLTIGDVVDDDLKQGMDPSAVSDEEPGDRITEHVRYLGEISTRHWQGITAFTLAAIAVGVLTTQPAVLLASVVGLAVASYSRAGTAPQLASLEIDRTLSDDSPQPGEEVTVSVTVENTGSSFLPDLRIVDRVPATMEVVDGSPRHGTSLRAGQSVTFQYTTVAERGNHSWPVQVVGRDFSGAIERDARITPIDDPTLECVPLMKTVVDTPVRMQTSLFAGEVNTETGGSGLEFYSVREHHPGDPLRRIDWKKYARSGELSTINFRQERTARVVLLFDTRSSAYVSSAPGEKHAVDLAVDSATDVFASLYDQGQLVGLAAFDTVSCWLGPGAGDTHIERAQRIVTEHTALSPIPPDVIEREGRHIEPMTHIRRQLPENTQIFMFSPLTDDYAYEVARRLDSAGHLVTMISPDPSANRTTGQRLARLERLLRVVQLREHGIRVIDWDPDTPLRVEMERAKLRWQA